MLERSERAAICRKTIQEALLLQAHIQDMGCFCAIPGELFEVCGCCFMKDCAANKIGLSLSHRQGNACVYLCSCNLAFAAGILREDDSNGWGVTIGPLILTDGPAPRADDADDAFAATIARLPAFSSSRLLALGSMLQHYLNGLSCAQTPEALLPLKLIHMSEPSEAACDPSVACMDEFEKRLLQSIRCADRPAAQAILNEMLGYVYFTNYENLQDVKNRVEQLLPALSRTTAACGRNVPDILDCCPVQLLRFALMKSMEEVNRALSEIIRYFLFTIFEPQSLKHTDVVATIKEYILANFDRKLTLEDIGRQVYLSHSYVSSIFKKETGLSVVDYANQIRIDRSKRLLLETDLSISFISSRCGFDDQSYFTRMFKKFVGMSPRNYRDTYGSSQGGKRGL